MGYYIECLHPQLKAMQLVSAIKDYDKCMGIQEPEKFNPPDGKAYVCVVSNGPFDAAAYVHDEMEFRSFTRPGDSRPRMWLLMDKTMAEAMSGFPGGVATMGFIVDQDAAGNIKDIRVDYI